MRLPCIHPASNKPKQRHHDTPTAFRKYLTSHTPDSPERILRLPGDIPHRLTATPQGGDCFFHALSWSLPSTPEPQSLRQTLSSHVRKNVTFYSAALHARGLSPRLDAARDAVENFCEDVVKGGVEGHWLGASWGELEILAVAKGFGVALELFTFDVKKQRVRPYFDVREGKRVVRMLFTGRAEAGHFDALLPVRSFALGRQFWARKNEK